MWRHVRTLGHVAHVAQVALIDDFAEVFFRDTVELAGLALVDQIKQSREGVAEDDATSAAMADIEDALLFLERRLFAVVIRILPIDRMPDRRFQAAFARCHGVGLVMEWASSWSEPRGCGQRRPPTFDMRAKRRIRRASARLTPSTELFRHGAERPNSAKP